jgi:hypothetical protein
MNKTALKNFATNARRELIKKVEAKALKIGISEENIKKAQIESSDAIYIDGKQLSITEKKQRDKLIQRIKDIGFNQVIEEVAYTWFNRFIALRFMEVNNYLPTKVRVLSSSNPDNPEPDILKEALSVDLDIDKELVYELKLNNITEELYKYLIIKQCNSLNKYLPFLFETIEDYKEILFPEGLLAKDSFLREMTDTERIPESDWEKVEIIGWLYQYYIAEEKDRVIKAKKRYKKEEIPFATQLFTPDWIVRYMVQNALGRYWVESHPEHRDLIKNWEFYLENPNPEPDFEEKLAPFINKDLRVEDIKCFDPAMGSGHILVYMFDVLYEIYSRCGYMEREIPRLIIENNLYGLDIDDRAYQLACFSVVMKATQYNSRFLRSIEKEGLKLNLASIQETNNWTIEEISFIAEQGSEQDFDTIKALVDNFKDAKIYGSLIEVNFETSTLEYFEHLLDKLKGKTLGSILIDLDLLIDKFEKLITQIKIMNQKFDVTITNPPYIGYKFLHEKLKAFIDNKYPNYGIDLFSVFVKYVLTCTEKFGQIGLVTPYSWMFIKNFEKLRSEIVHETTISTLIQLEPNAFETAAIPVCTFTLRNYCVDVVGQYIKLNEFKGINVQEIKVKEAIINPNVSYRFSVNNKVFIDIPGERIAYWISDEFRNLFLSSNKLENHIDISGSLNKTGNNDKYLRNFWEVNLSDVYNKRWSLYAKGGDYRRWFGNIEHVIDWSDEAREFYKTNSSSNLLDSRYWYRKGINYNGVSLRGFTVRLVDQVISDVGGPTFHVKDNDLQYYVLAYLNTKIASTIIQILNPTPNTQVNDVKNIPFIITEDNNIRQTIDKLAKECVEIAKKDWDEFENSIDFKITPLLKYKTNSGLIEDAFNKWMLEKEYDFTNLKEKEQELNRLFIEIYQLDKDFTSYVDEEEITLRKADLSRDIRHYISYAVGCMLGRYSIDVEGIVYAGGEFDQTKYKSYPASKDGIIPILYDSFFEDDIVQRFLEFVKVTFGEENIYKNLDFIANALGKTENESSIERIRKYFISDFFNDHISIFSTRGRKAPIYWLFTSGRQKAFNCLVYMHRYDKTTLSRIRTDYLHPLQMRLDAERKSLLEVIEGGGTAKEISNAKKELKQLDLKIEELKTYDELLHHMADMQIEIDLDDGVAVNYAKFNGLLAKLD